MTSLIRYCEICFYGWRHDCQQTLLSAGCDAVLQDCDGRDAADYCPYDAEYVKALLRQHAGKLLGQHANKLLRQPTDAKL